MTFVLPGPEHAETKNVPFSAKSLTADKESVQTCLWVWVDPLACVANELMNRSRMDFSRIYENATGKGVKARAAFSLSEHLFCFLGEGTVLCSIRVSFLCQRKNFFFFFFFFFGWVKKDVDQPQCEIDSSLTSFSLKGFRVFCFWWQNTMLLYLEKCTDLFYQFSLLLVFCCWSPFGYCVWSAVLTSGIFQSLVTRIHAKRSHLLLVCSLGYWELIFYNQQFACSETCFLCGRRRAKWLCPRT